MCLYGLNLNVIRNIIPHCSWQACGGMSYCQYVLGVSEWPQHLYIPIHLYGTHTSVHPQYVPSISPICLYVLYICTPFIHLYAPCTSLCPIHLYTSCMFPYIYMPPVHPPLLYLIHLYTPPYIFTSTDIYTCIRYNSILQWGMIPVSSICFYHCSMTNCRLHVSKDLYRNLDFCLVAKQYTKLQFMGPDSC